MTPERSQTSSAGQPHRLRSWFGRASLAVLATTAIAFAAVTYAGVAVWRTYFGPVACFNERTGQPIKWFVIDPRGQVILYDRPGSDRSGVARRPVTAEICRIQQAQREGIRPRQIVDDPETVKFFDDVTGEPRVWYAMNPDGRIDLFDAEGTHPQLGEPLAPISPDVIQQVIKDARTVAAARQAWDQQIQGAKPAETAQTQADKPVQVKPPEASQSAATKEAQSDNQVQTQRAQGVASLAREQSDTPAAMTRPSPLMEVFGTRGYIDGAVLLGAVPTRTDDVSIRAAKEVAAAVATSLQIKGIKVDDFRPKVYASGHFETLLNGDASALSEAGLAQKMRAAVVMTVDATCRPPAEKTAIVSCTLLVQQRVIGPSGQAVTRQWTQVGAGPSPELATARAAELLVARNSDWLNGA